MLKSPKNLNTLVLAMGSILTGLSCMKEDVVSPSAEADMATADAVIGLPKIAFVSDRGGATHIYTMYPDGSGLKRLTGDLCSQFGQCVNEAPAWSPSGGSLTFTSYKPGKDYEVYVMDRTGGNKRNVSNYAGPDRSPAWSPDALWIAFSRDYVGDDLDTEIWKVRPNGTGRKDVSNDQSADFERSPAWSRDSRKIAWRREQGSVNAEVAVKNADGTGPTIILPHSFHGGYPRPDWSPTSMEVAYESGEQGDIVSDIYVSNDDGSSFTRLTTPADCPNSSYCKAEVPRWSPDGRRIAFVLVTDAGADIWIMNRDGGGKKQLTTAPQADGAPTWSPDGRKIAFVSARDGNTEIYVMNADGSGQRNLTRNPAQDGSPTWSH